MIEMYYEAILKHSSNLDRTQNMMLFFDMASDVAAINLQAIPQKPIESN